jgi:hypothetical protein
MKKALFSLAVFSLLLSGSASKAAALSDALVPNFPSCVSPSGTQIVSYDSGVHGVVGQSGEYVGSDAVYTVEDSNLVQCLCSSNGQGIQTNWWKTSSLTSEQYSTLTKDGWIYIPSGIAWGLQDAPYLAKNSDYNCLNSTPTPNQNTGFSQPDPGSAPVCNSAKPPTPALLSVDRSGSTATVRWTAVTPADHYSISYGTQPDKYIYGVPNVGNVTSFTIGSLDPNTQYYFQVRAVNNCMPSDPSGSTSGQVLGASTGEVLGLAYTGDSIYVYLTAIAGVTLISLGVYLHRHEI